MADPTFETDRASTDGAAATTNEEDPGFRLRDRPELTDAEFVPTSLKTALLGLIHPFRTGLTLLVRLLATRSVGNTGCLGGGRGSNALRNHIGAGMRLFHRVRRSYFPTADSVVS